MVRCATQKTYSYLTQRDKIQSSVTKACCRRRDTVQIYQQLYESGLQYGPAFRLLRNVHVPDMAAV